MAKGFDDWKNGLFLGAAFGALLYYATTFTGSFLSFLNGWFGLVTWINAQSFMSWSSASITGYAIAVIVGAIIGIYIDKS